MKHSRNEGKKIIYCLFIYCFLLLRNDTVPYKSNPLPTPTSLPNYQPHLSEKALTTDYMLNC